MQWPWAHIKYALPLPRLYTNFISNEEAASLFDSRIYCMHVIICMSKITSVYSASFVFLLGWTLLAKKAWYPSSEIDMCDIISRIHTDDAAKWVGVDIGDGIDRRWAPLVRRALLFVEMKRRSEAVRNRFVRIVNALGSWQDRWTDHAAPF